jgi:hypothetical protein
VPHGPAPKPATQRRRCNAPKSHGDAESVAETAARPEARQLGIDDPHPLIQALWDAVQKSCESQFYSSADQARLRLECWFANRTMTSGQPTANAWNVVQDGLTEMLVGAAAVKRRAGVELRRAATDPDEEAAVSLAGKYQLTLRSV